MEEIRELNDSVPVPKTSDFGLISFTLSMICVVWNLSWLTNGIRISCANKRKLYLTYRNSNDSNHKEYYKKYCQILTTVIMRAKKLHYKFLLKSNNKQKTTWHIVKTITNNKNTINTISTMNINDKLSSNPLAIANAFNSYFSPVAEMSLSKTFLERILLIIMIQ